MYSTDIKASKQFSRILQTTHSLIAQNSQQSRFKIPHLKPKFMGPHFASCVFGPWVVYDLDRRCQEFIIKLSGTGSGLSQVWAKCVNVEDGCPLITIEFLKPTLNKSDTEAFFLLRQCSVCLSCTSLTKALIFHLSFI